MPCPFSLGDQFCRAPRIETVICDKTFECCRDIFRNEAHYGGFPTQKDEDHD